MQYKISLPDNYDMNVIRQRVADNGHRTDGFQDLYLKHISYLKKEILQRVVMSILHYMYGRIMMA